MSEQLTVLGADALVAVHTRLERSDAIKAGQAGGDVMVRRLAELGVMAVFVPGGTADAYRRDGSGLWVRRAHTVTHSDEKGLTVVDGGYLELPIGERGGITAMRTRVTKSLPAGVDRLIPVVNGPEATRLDNKLVQRKLFAECMAAGVIVEPGEEMDNLSGLPEVIWLKTANGLAGKGGYRTKKSEVAELLAAVRLERANAGKADQGWVIEEDDVGLPIPGLCSLVPELQRFIDNAPLGVNHEVRIHCFAHRLNGDLVIDLAPVFRFSAGDSTWIPVDPSSLPSDFVDMAVRATTIALDQSGYSAIQLAVDAYQSSRGRRMREWNVRDPAMGSWLAVNDRRLTNAEKLAMGAVANREHGGRLAELLAPLAKAAYNK